MSRTVRTEWIGLLLLLFAVTNATGAFGTPDVAETVRDAADGLHEDAADAQELAGQVKGQGEAQAGEARGAAQDAAADAQEKPAVAVEEAIEFLDEMVLRPTEERVEAVQRTLLAAPEPGAEPAPAEAGPASQTVEPQVVPTPVLVAAGAAAAGAGALLFWLAGSSGGAAGAGAGGAGAQALGHDPRRILPFASPLFTRFARDTVMGHPKREELYARIVAEPGVSLQAMCDATGLSRTAVTHHLRLLEHHHLVVSRRVGRSRHYFENGGRYGRDQKEAYAILQNERSRQIASYIRSHPGAIQKSVCSALGLQASIAHWHVRRLADASLIEPVRSGRTVSYYPTPGLQAIEA